MYSAPLSPMPHGDFWGDPAIKTTLDLPSNIGTLTIFKQWIRNFGVSENNISSVFSDNINGYLNEEIHMI